MKEKLLSNAQTIKFHINLYIIVILYFLAWYTIMLPNIQPLSTPFTFLVVVVAAVLFLCGQSHVHAQQQPHIARHKVMYCNFTQIHTQNIYMKLLQKSEAIFIQRKNVNWNFLALTVTFQIKKIEFLFTKRMKKHHFNFSRVKEKLWGENVVAVSLLFGMAFECTFFILLFS